MKSIYLLNHLLLFFYFPKMEKKSFKLLFLIKNFFGLNTYSCDINIETRVLKCSKTNVLINLESICLENSNRMTFTGIINVLNILKYLINDEYRVVYTLESKNIFYISTADVFNTNYAIIHKFSIIEDFQNCTKHLRLQFKQDS